MKIASLDVSIFLGGARGKPVKEDQKPDSANKEGGDSEAGSQQLSKAELKRLRREKQVTSHWSRQT